LIEDEKQKNDQGPQSIQDEVLVSLLTEDEKESQNDQKPQGIQQAQESLNTEISNQRSVNSFLPINLITPTDDELAQVPVKQDQETFSIPVVKPTTRRGRGQGGHPQIFSGDSTRSAFACNRCKVSLTTPVPSFYSPSSIYDTRINKPFTNFSLLAIEAKMRQQPRVLPKLWPPMPAMLLH